MNREIGQFTGAVVKWLGTLGFKAESRREVVRSRPGFAIPGLKNSVNPAVNAIFFESGKDKAARKGMGSAFHLLYPRWDELRFSSVLPKIQPTAPMAIRLWKTFTGFKTREYLLND